MMVTLTEEGQEYESQAEILDDLISDGYSKTDSIIAINHCASLNSMDLGDDVYLFLAGLDYQKSKKKRKKQFAKQELNNEVKK